MKKILSILIATSLLASPLAGCSNSTDKTQNEQAFQKVSGLDFSYKVNPETFEVVVEHNGKTEIVSKAQEKREVSDFTNKESHSSWTYPKEDIKISLQKKEDYLDVMIQSTKDSESSFSWPVVEGQNYMLPIGEGRTIPSQDEHWKKYLNGSEMHAIESLSMGFFAVNHEQYSTLYVMKEAFNSTLKFNTKDNISFTFTHEFPSINEKKEYGFRIYVAKNDPVQLAKIYKSYIVEKGEFKTLKEKAKENKNIEMLYGAPHIYLWDTTVISENDIIWKAFREQLSSKTMTYVKEFLSKEIEEGQEAVNIMDEVSKQDYVDNYQKNTISQMLSKALVMPSFYKEDIFTKSDKKMERLLQKDIEELNEVEMIELNKCALQNNLPSVFSPVDEWANDRTLDLVKKINDAGIDKAWFGLDNWIQGFIKPEMVNYATSSGYLMGPYDSYHSIHEPGKEKWHSATFKDTKLFDKATIEGKDGEKLSGFQNVGRKLNPTLSLPSVQGRLESILNTGISFNSWFIDCDATGEIYDDYSKNHITTQQEDLQARLERMSYIRDAKKMVIGSEGGNDFAASTIAFAHGIELPAFSWMDEDMKKNKDSQYYMGRYYSSRGGAPEKVTKQIPMKEEYKKFFLDPTYKLPLYKLVYNDSVITSYHWDWSTFKIIDEIENRMLYEILYNVPPMYHIDKFEWEKHGKKMAAHTKVWSKFSKSVINKEMTNFKTLTDDHLVQKTEYGNNIKVVANFSGIPYKYNKDTVQPKSLIIYDGDMKISYQP
ncbi:glycoside hydrolase [Bacillus massiliigorillae]|uniref:glycoside hydrolase n=1 Tax=Bacillus massiliigorillae TaxID=1243664 RepID=UPI00039AA044|nr:glycoside hydrolase [Bacillus massiliigorillae]